MKATWWCCRAGEGQCATTVARLHYYKDLAEPTQAHSQPYAEDPRGSSHSRRRECGISETPRSALTHPLAARSQTRANLQDHQLVPVENPRK